MDKKNSAQGESRRCVNSSSNHQQNQQQASRQKTTKIRSSPSNRVSTSNDQTNEELTDNQFSNYNFMENLRQLFQECDTDKNGYLGRNKFKDLCLKISLDENDAYEIFDRLDIDQSGTITFEEFCDGFNQCQAITASGADNSIPPEIVDNVVGSDKQIATMRASNKAPSPSTVVDINGEDSNSFSSLDHQSASGITTEENRLFSTSKSYTRGLHRNGSSFSRLNNISPIGTISIGHDGSSENTRDITDINDNSPMLNSQHDDGMIVFSSGDNNLPNNNKQVMTMQDLLDCVQTLQDENHKLAVSLMKEKKDRDEYLSRLGEEMDQQVKEVEARVGQRAKEEVESERRRLREMMKAEFDGLQTHFQTLEKVNDWIKTTGSGKNIDSDKIEKVKTKLEDSLLENRQLRMSLLNTQTNVAIIRNEIDQLKEQYEEKCQELSTEREKVYETLNECDHIKRQLSLMRSSNRKLQDTSDAITTYIADVDPVVKGATYPGPTINPVHALIPHHSGATSPKMPRNSSRHALGGLANLVYDRRGSILSDYIHDLSISDKSASITSDLESLTSQMSTRNPYDDPEDRSSQQSVPTYNSRAGSNLSHLNNNVPGGLLYHQIDNNNHSQHSRCSGSSMERSASKPLTMKNNHQNHFLIPSKHQHHNATANKYNSQQQVALKKSRSYQNIDSDNKYNNNLQKHQQQGGLNKIGVNDPDSDEQTSFSISTLASSHQLQNESISKSHSMGSMVSLPRVEIADGPSTTTYDIILVGDSYVGKSSFVARFMEGEFVVGLISNCGIDFKTKNYKVDGVNITVNLWDTAGQERFRSITASYFRKADGIILMYDVTEKNSYLNVRNWMSTIMDTAAENVPVLLIGNKIDLRTLHNLNACVPSGEGHRLAQEYGIVFLETSVKDGTNLIGCIGKLVRLMMMRNEKLSENGDTIKLNDKSKTFRCMPQKC